MSAPTLREQRTKDLIEVRDYLIGEMVDGCGSGVGPSHWDTFAALAWILTDELRVRDPRRKLRDVPTQRGGRNG